MTHSIPIVSVIIPIYNAARYLSKTLDSVRIQSFTNFEVIMIDDGSTDSSIEIAEEISKIDSRFSLIRSNHNSGGPAGPRNIGISLAKSKWIAFCDADDVWFPDKLMVQLQTMEDKNAKLCAVNLIDFSNDRLLKIPETQKTTVKKITFLKMLFNSRIRISGVIVSRDLVRYLKFKESSSYKAREDYDFWLQCHEMIRSSIKILEPMGGYRVSEGQISGDKFLMIKRHYWVLKNYKRQNGVQIGELAIIFTITHFVMAFFKRKLFKTC